MRIMRYVVIGVIVGLGFVIFEIPLTFDNIFNLFLISFIVIGGFVLSKILYVNKELKKYLIDSGYSLKKVEEKINKMAEDNLKITLLINISVAYSIKKDYENAIRILDSIDISKKMGRIKVVYYNNLVVFLLKSGQVLESSELLNKNMDLFNKYLTNIQTASFLKHTIEEVEKAVSEINK